MISSATTLAASFILSYGYNVFTSIDPMAILSTFPSFNFMLASSMDLNTSSVDCESLLSVFIIVIGTMRSDSISPRGVVRPLLAHKMDLDAGTPPLSYLLMCFCCGSHY